MIPNDLPKRQQMIDRMLGILENEKDKLTDWESNFLESISNQFDDKGTLSDRQCEILERIYDKVS